jgi:hypothetical protein
VVSEAEEPRFAGLAGAIISFRPPRCFRTASGTRTVSICAAPVMLRSSLLRLAAQQDHAPG